MMEKDDILRKPKPIIGDRIDLRHRIMDTLIDSGVKLQSAYMGLAVDKIDEILWTDGDMRTTRLRYDLFTTFRRKGIDLEEHAAAELFDETADMLLSRGTGLDFDGLGPQDIDARRAERVVEALELLASVNQRLVAVLERLEHPIIEHTDAGIGPVTGPDLTEQTPGANQETEKPSKSGTPGGKGKSKP